MGHWSRGRWALGIVFNSSLSRLHELIRLCWSTHFTLTCYLHLLKTTTSFPACCYWLLWFTLLGRFISDGRVEVNCWESMQLELWSTYLFLYPPTTTICWFGFGLACAAFIYWPSLQSPSRPSLSTIYFRLFSCAIYFRLFTFFDNKMISFSLQSHHLCQSPTHLSASLFNHQPRSTWTSSPLCRHFISISIRETSSPSLNFSSTHATANFLCHTDAIVYAIFSSAFLYLFLSCFLVSFAACGPPSFQLKNNA